VLGKLCDTAELLSHLMDVMDVVGQLPAGDPMLAAFCRDYAVSRTCGCKVLFTSCTSIEPPILCFEFGQALFAIYSLSVFQATARCAVLCMHIGTGLTAKVQSQREAAVSF
jgi:hypothetical protein